MDIEQEIAVAYVSGRRMTKSGKRVEKKRASKRVSSKSFRREEKFVLSFVLFHYFS